MTTLTKVKFAWKYRRPLWKYRALIRRRREIAWAAAGLIAAGTGILLRRNRIEQMDVQRG